MISVSISINGVPLFTRSARNTGKKDHSGRTAYVTDAGEYVYHSRANGAIELAKLLLDTIEAGRIEKQSEREE